MWKDPFLWHSCLCCCTNRVLEYPIEYTFSHDVIGLVYRTRVAQNHLNSTSIVRCFYEHPLEAGRRCFAESSGQNHLFRTNTLSPFQWYRLTPLEMLVVEVNVPFSVQVQSHTTRPLSSLAGRAIVVYEVYLECWARASLASLGTLDLPRCKRSTLAKIGLVWTIFVHQQCPYTVSLVGFLPTTRHSGKTLFIGARRWTCSA